jgi:7-cyano-7-deazaguanine reductase
MTSLKETPLGKETRYPEHYAPELLFPIPRADGRSQIGLNRAAGLPFYGEDLWNAYEISWLDPTGKPAVAVMEIRVPITSPFLVESKSMKLYLNSFNMSRYPSTDEMAAVVTDDLSRAFGAPVSAAIVAAEDFGRMALGEPPGKCLDGVTPKSAGYTVAPGCLTCEPVAVSEAWFSRLFRSVCPVTGQPDWGTVAIDYTGPRIDPAGLLGYLISYRRHAGFHENCVERMFMDISRRCRPTELSVAARFMRRGGLDINPVRTSAPTMVKNIRDPRQ